MKAVIQRVQRATVRSGELEATIGPGLLVLVGLETGDTEILAVSQFTLAGSIARGRRPSFDGAMNPEAARVLFRRFLELLRAQYPRVKSGFFQEHMEVELVNDGPVTFILER